MNVDLEDNIFKGGYVGLDTTYGGMSLKFIFRPLAL